jgi:hypothetical protein
MARRARVAGLLAIVFGAAIIVGWIASALLGPIVAGPSSGTAARPTPHPYAPLTLMISSDASSPRRVTITTDGECVALQPSQTLFDACSLAVNADPAVIGGAALGRLNNQHTPSFDALVWRGRADANPGICSKGGLEGSRLAACETDVARSDYSLSDAGIVVTIVPSQ